MKDLRMHIDEVQQKIGYQFHNKDLLLQAFTRSSYAVQHGVKSNEILELIGDIVLEYFVIKIMADKFGYVKKISKDLVDSMDRNDYNIKFHKTEEDFTDLKKLLVANDALAKRFETLDLMEYVYLGDSDLKNKGFRINQTKIKADIVEAILGAIAIDCQWDVKTLENTVEKIIGVKSYLKNFENEKVQPLTFHIENSINVLQELATKMIVPPPEYLQSNDKELTTDGQLMWKCTCFFKGNTRTEAFANSKREAKKMAAYLMLCQIYDLSNHHDLTDV